MEAQVLVVEDDALLRTLVSERLHGRGRVARTAGSLREARALLRVERPDAAIVATHLPDGPGAALLRDLGGSLPVPCIMVAPAGEVGAALDAVGRGADDYLERPFTLERLETTLEAALERGRLRREIRALRARLEDDVDVSDHALGIGDALERVERIAPAADATVLLVGEPGTGKRVLARFIHRLSPRSHRAFVAFHGAAREGEDVAAELFGREGRGDVGGAAGRRGLVEAAAGGTLYLDEVPALPRDVQDRVLRLLDARAYRRDGAKAELGADVRVVASCSRPPGLEVAEGRLLEDLHDRLGLLRIQLRPLRRRPSDIPVLAQAFLRRSAVELGRPARRFAPAALERLREHSWPGNVRELRNVVEAAVLRAEGERISPEHLPEELRGQGPRRVTPRLRLGPQGVDLDELEKRLVLEALRRSDGNRTEAGRLLGLSRHQIRNRLKKYGVER